MVAGRDCIRRETSLPAIFPGIGGAERRAHHQRSMTHKEFRALCEQVLVPMIDKLFKGYHAETEEMFGTIMRDVLRMGDVLEAFTSASGQDDLR